MSERDLDGQNMRDAVRKIHGILKMDDKDTTYKFALLRGLIEVAEQYDHLREEQDEGYVVYPTGILLEKWLYYYYPLVERKVPQKNSEDPREDEGKKIAFRRQFETITDYYRKRGGFGHFWSDYKRGRLPSSLTDDLLNLLKKIRYTVTRYPMKHLGYSYFEDHFRVAEEVKSPIRFTKNNKPEVITRDYLIRSFGKYRLQKDFNHLFRLVGGILLGTESILYQWAAFTSEANREYGITISKALDMLSHVPDLERDVKDARKVYLSGLKESGLYCVWSGKTLRESSLQVDHAIPFSLWQNNDLWNLLPTSETVNRSKRDRIPAPDLIDSRRDQIQKAWDVMRNSYTDAFERELRNGLLGLNKGESADMSLSDGVDQLAEKCELLISDRGLPEWEPPASMQTSRSRPVDEKDDEEEEARESSDRVLPYERVPADEIWNSYLPVVGNIAAGELGAGFFSEDVEEEEKFDWARVPAKIARRDRFVVRVAGDSMEPAISEGDLVVFEYCRNVQEEGQIVIGSYALSMDEPVSSAIKRIYKEEDGWRFESENPDYESIFISREEAPDSPILGIAVFDLTGGISL